MSRLLPAARAVGCIFGELMLRKPLLPGSTELDQLQKIFELLGPPTEAQWPDFPTLPLTPTLPFALAKFGRGNLFAKLPHLSSNVRGAVRVADGVRRERGFPMT